MYVAPQEAILSAKVHLAAGLSGEDVARLLDAPDQRLRGELPEVGEVFIDVTAHRR